MAGLVPGRTKLHLSTGHHHCDTEDNFRKTRGPGAWQCGDVDRCGGGLSAMVGHQALQGHPCRSRSHCSSPRGEIDEIVAELVTTVRLAI